MDANTWSILEKIEKAEARILKEFHELRKEVQDLQYFKHRVAGMSFVLGIVGAGAFELLIALFKH